VDKPLEVMLVGAAGVVGGHVLSALLEDSRFFRVVAPTRRPLNEHAKLMNPVVDFSRLPEDVPWWRIDAVICTLGTTIKVAGSQAAFAAVDRELPIRIARPAKQAGTTRFALNSSLGASRNGNFYLRTKAEAEIGIRGIAYPYFAIARPSLIDAKREPSRPAESASMIAARVLKPLMPRRNRAVTPDRIARALIECVLAEAPGEHIVESGQLQP
jgi:uncharacterized protein YbjT (DUF2867 family)